MIRKWMSVLLALMLAVMMPVCAMAEALQHTLTIVPGDFIAAEPAIADLLDVLALTVTPGEKSGALTVTLGDTDIVTAALGADTTALYAYSSELLGETVVHVTWDDAFELIKGLVAMQMYNENVDTAGIESIMSQIDLYKQQLIAAIGGEIQVNTGMVSKEEAMAQLGEVLGDYPEMMAWAEELYGKLTTEEGAFTSELRDTADQKYSLTMTEEDILKLMDTDYVEYTIQSQMLQTNPDLDGDTLAKETEEALQEAREELEKLDMEITADVYTLDAGATLVGLDLVMNILAADETEEDGKVTMNYSRYTGDNGVSYKGDMWMGVEEMSIAEMKLDVFCGNDGVTDGLFGILADGEEFVVDFGAKETDANVCQSFASLYMRSDATAILEPAASDRPLITFNVLSQPADPAVLAVIDAADVSTSVDVLKLSEEEMQAFGNNVSSRAMQVLFTAMSKLPTSTLSLFMGEAQ